ncbi:MAG TPA: hypothetical protein DEP35_08245, partial [Deltaproteobacteria bacterium]|nr:hypothetical protein [Deltaproteobacteria bacterium]
MELDEGRFALHGFELKGRFLDGLAQLGGRAQGLRGLARARSARPAPLAPRLGLGQLLLERADCLHRLKLPGPAGVELGSPSLGL